MNAKVQMRISRFKSLLNTFHNWNQRQLEQHWITVADHHMAHEYLMDINKLILEYDVEKDSELNELQKIQSKYATFVTQYGCPDLSTAVELLYGRRYIEKFSTLEDKQTRDIWNTISTISEVRRVSRVVPSTECVKFSDFYLYDVEHNVSTLESFKNSLMGIYFTIPDVKYTYIIHCTLPPITLKEVSLFDFDTWKKSVLDNRPEKECFNTQSFELFLDTILFRMYLFAQTHEELYILYYGCHGWSLKTIQKPMNQLTRQFLSCSLDEKYNWIYRALIFQEIHCEWSQLIFVLFDLMHKYKTEVVNYEGQMLETPIISTTWEQSSLYNWLPFDLKRKLRRAIKDSFDKSIQLEGSDEDPNEHLPIEQRIRFMKTSENVKRKALTKWREVKMKQDENSSKARQYVEGLLRIPFGVYREEPCLKLFSQIKKQEDKHKTILEETYCNLSFDKSIQWTRNELNEIPNRRKHLIHFVNFLNELFNHLDIANHPVHIEHCKMFLPMFPLRITGKRQQEIRKIIFEMVEWLLENANEPKIVLILHSMICYLYNDKNPDTTKMFHSCKINPYNTDVVPELSVYYPVECFQEYPIEHHFVQWQMPKAFLLKTPLMSRLLNESFQVKQPWNKIKEILNGFHTTLEKSIHGHNQAKRQIERILGQWMRGEQGGYCFGFEGPPGVGKTSLAKYGLANCLKDENGESRPFQFIALGGSTHGNTLEGHNYTYLGSTWGRLVDILMEKECMNPIIFIDELDKVSKTEHGQEIIGILTHLVDPTQNTHIHDKYFNGVDLDFSKALIVFSYNDVDAIDRVLLDRIHRVKFSPLSINEKITVARDYLLPELSNKFQWDLPEFSDDILKNVIKKYTREAGVRKFKEILFEIISEMNLEYLKEIHLRLPITMDTIDKYLKERTPVITRTILDEQQPGLVNGMWANSMGQGGLLTVEASWCPAKEPLHLTLTGSQGDVMKESMTVARTVAWGLLSPESQQKQIELNSGIHIHCPENATPKDGPSAGCCITLAILSLMMKRNVPTNMAFTGEISLNHKVTAIGGLEQKIIGSIDTGVEIFFYPQENARDAERIREKYPDLNCKLIAIDTFEELLEYVWKI